MRGCLALVWAAPGAEDAYSPIEKDSNKMGHGHPAPSTILVVEDEVLIRLAIADYLRDCGYRVLEAHSGEEAQSILSSGELVEILFADINLGGGINGFELAQWTRAHFKGIRIVLTSGAHKSAEIAADLCDGPLLTKPYSYERLAEHIKSLLGGLGRRSGG